MTYYDIINIFSKTSLQHKFVKEFKEGDIYEFLNSGEHKYGSMTLTVDNVNVNKDVTTMNANLFFVDRLLDNKDNKAEIQSVALRALQDVFLKIEETHPEISLVNSQYTPFDEKFADWCAGVYCTFSVTYPSEIICSDDIFIPKTLTITNNGEYNVTNYDKVIINIQ